MTGRDDARTSSVPPCTIHDRIGAPTPGPACMKARRVEGRPVCPSEKEVRHAR